MKKLLFALSVLSLAFWATTAQGQDRKMRKKAAVVEAKATVAADKADLKVNKAERKADKMVGDKEELKEDRKAMMHKRGKLVKDQVKKDVKVVKQKL